MSTRGNSWKMSLAVAGMCALFVISTIGGGVGLTGAAASQSQTDVRQATAAGDHCSENSELIDITDEIQDRLSGETQRSDLPEICVWERAPFPLRADGSTAATQIELPATFVRASDSSDASINRDALSVFQQGETATISFDSASASNADTGQFSGDNVELIKLNSNTENPLNSLSGEVSAADGTITFESQDVDAAVDDVGQLNENGAVDLSVTPEQSGAYAYVLIRANSGEGAEVNADGDLTLSGNVDLIGVEVISVQKTASTSTPQSDTIAPGEDVTFDVNANLGSDGTAETAHSIILYQAEELQTRQVIFETDASIAETADLSVSDDDFTVRTNIEGANGVIETIGDATVYGVTLDGRRSEGLVTVRGTANDVTPDATVELDSDATPIDASTTTLLDGTASDKLTVETLPGFDEGEYRFVHIAQRDGDISTTSGTVTLASETPTQPPDDGDNGGGTPDGGSDTAMDAGDDESPPQQNQPDVTVSQTDRGVRAEIQNAQPGVAAQIDIRSSSPAPTADVEEIDITPQVAGDFTVDVERLTTPPVDTPSVPPASGTPVRYVRIDTSLSNPNIEQAQVTFRVSNERLEQRAGSADGVVLNRLTEDGWQTLSTEPIEPTADGDATRFRATTPGFSLFAIGVQESNISVTDATLAQSTIAVGEQVDVDVTVENTGSNNGTATLTLTADNDTIATQDITVQADAERTVTFTPSFDTADTFDIAVNSVVAGTLEVEDTPSTPTATPTATATPTETETSTPTATPDEDEEGIPLIVLALIAVLVGVVGVLLRQADG